MKLHEMQEALDNVQSKQAALEGASQQVRGASAPCLIFV
jgi:hypothetical protein